MEPSGFFSLIPVFYARIPVIVKNVFVFSYKLYVTNNNGIRIFCAHMAIYNNIFSTPIVSGKVFKTVFNKGIYYGTVGNKVLRLQIITLHHRR